jgi:hypothetical protein
MKDSIIKWWFSILLIVILFVCSWITIGINHAIHEPPETATDKARNAFILSCETSTYGNRNGVPNVTVTPWTCVIPTVSGK